MIVPSVSQFANRKKPLIASRQKIPHKLSRILGLSVSRIRIPDFFALSLDTIIVYTNRLSLYFLLRPLVGDKTCQDQLCGVVAE